MEKCSTCMGFGLWNDDSGQPMGPMDAEDGMPTKACPECGASANPRAKPIGEMTPGECVMTHIGRDGLVKMGLNPLNFISDDDLVKEAAKIANENKGEKI